ncbi:hypothetical protein [Streptomyces hydrogenans]|uniref:hypothetical protein n=1 Tax=Streptomyces hydrogenans TaxID=1873719 RepID=UPI0033D3EDDF
MKLRTRAATEAATAAVPAQKSSTKSERSKAKKKKRAAAATVDGTGAKTGKKAQAKAAKAAAAERSAEEDRRHRDRLRWATFNASAAAAGHLAIWGFTGDAMAGADYMARLSISVPELAASGLTVASLIGGWKGAGMVHLHRLPGVAGLAARPAAAIAASMWGQGTAPVVRDALWAIEPWGTTLAPLLAVAPVAAACWWGLDRRFRQAAPAVRWFARVPLATVTLSALLYAPGAVL